MLLLDVNILVLAHRVDFAANAPIRAWMENVLSAGNLFGVPSLALSGFLRIVTRKPFDPPTPINDALDYCARFRDCPHCRVIQPGPRHWEIFDRLCRKTRAAGNLVPDAYFAAMAIELDCEWVSMDRDFSKFPGLTWRHPLDVHSTTNPL